jgi:deazaflavin-dependent oxidoreductase (nitroreductase family)
MPPKAIFRTLNRIHIALYRKSGGKILGSVVGSPVLLLTTTGRKTGHLRTVPIVYAPYGDCYIVIASDDPAWYRNLKNAGCGWVEIKGRTITVEMEDAPADTTADLWAKLIAQSPAFQSFQHKPDHQLVILEPVRPAKPFFTPHPESGLQ